LEDCLLEENTPLFKSKEVCHTSPMPKTFNKTIVIMGPTASGKSDLAIALAKKYDGEIISADSRQVYRGMDIGTGKVARDRTGNVKVQMTNDKFRNCYFSEGIRHHLIDVASPKRSYNVTHFVRDAKRTLADIQKRGKIPIICGGTGFWIQALLEESSFPAVKPDWKLRKKLSKLSAEELFKRLKKKDPIRAKSIDAKNKIRLIRALEICASIGTVPHPQHSTFNIQHSYVVIALSPPQETLWNNIDVRLEKRIAQGMVAEIEHLRASGLSWKRLESFGLEYEYVALFLQKKISKNEMVERLNFEIRHYAKRQLTWLRRFEKTAPIHWITAPDEADPLYSSLQKHTT
jgi:tRNA dimethylallyltransferase